MSDYRRLISYIYAYEGAGKGKNIGFAKLESRNGQCRIGVSVKKVYVGGNDMGVYLLSDMGEIFLGKIFIRSGSGEFRTAVKTDNVEGSGRRLENCYGLTVHDVQDSWRSYTTIWDDGAARETGDTVAQAAEIELAGLTSENLKKEQQEKEGRTAEKREEKEEPVTPFQLFQVPPPQITADFECSGAIVPPPACTDPENREERESRELYEPAPERWSFEESLQSGTEEEGRERAGTEDGVRDRQVSRYMSGIGSVREELNRLSGALTKSDRDAGSETVQQQKSMRDPERGARAVPERAPEIIQTFPQEGKFFPEDISDPGPERKENRETDREADLPAGPEEEPEMGTALEPEISGEAVWGSFRKRYPKIDAFDYGNGCEILRIRPQDIGLLPRENWVYGNNSFLLHGYYNYHCLILVRLNNPNGRSRFLLGVPGHYFSNEKYMASMFGFPHFVLSKKQPMENGRFGYWYTDVKLGQ